MIWSVVQYSVYSYHKENRNNLYAQITEGICELQS